MGFAKRLRTSDAFHTVSACIVTWQRDVTCLTFKRAEYVWRMFFGPLSSDRIEYCSCRAFGSRAVELGKLTRLFEQDADWCTTHTVVSDVCDTGMDSREEHETHCISFLLSGVTFFDFVRHQLCKRLSAVGAGDSSCRSECLACDEREFRNHNRRGCPRALY